MRLKHALALCLWLIILGSLVSRAEQAPISGSAQVDNPAARLLRPRPDVPNIIFILADDLGYGEVGAYGQKRIQTPNLDRLAAEGMRFTQAYAGSTVCAPSRSTLMTGQHTGHTRVRGNDRVGLRAEDVTVAEVLKRAGYRTAIIGKWGLGRENTPGHPNSQGFDEFFGFLDQTAAHNYYPESLWRNEREITFGGNALGNRTDYAPDLFTRAALNFIRVNKRQPFFLYLAYTTPHAHNAMTRKTGNGMEVPTDVPYSLQDWPQPEKNKAAMITRMDADVGRILDALRQLKLDNETIVFFSSDNGPHREGGNDPAFFQASGPLRGIKRSLTEGGIRVPMLVRWPGKIAAGLVSDHPWAFWDFLPTAAELARTQAPAGVDGRSVLPVLLGGKPGVPADRPFYWEFHEKGFHQAARIGNWKAIRPAGQPVQLYDLARDPAESKDLAAEHPEVVRRFEEHLKSARTESADFPVN